jgi:hypothetical protein
MAPETKAVLGLSAQRMGAANRWHQSMEDIIQHSFNNANPRCQTK